MKVWYTLLFFLMLLLCTMETSHQAYYTNMPGTDGAAAAVPPPASATFFFWVCRKMPQTVWIWLFSDGKIMKSKDEWSSKQYRQALQTKELTAGRSAWRSDWIRSTPKFDRINVPRIRSEQIEGAVFKKKASDIQTYLERNTVLCY
jgi:hypothetical protein